MHGGLKSHMDYRDGNSHTINNSRFNEGSLKLNAGLNRKSGSYQLFYNYNAMNLGMTTPGALDLVQHNARKNEYWYQELINHFLLAKNKFFLGRYKVGANISWQKNMRKLHTDEENEVDMGLNVLSYDLKTWFPTSESTEFILGVQGAFIDNSNHNGHIQVLPDYRKNDVALLGWLKHTHKNNLSMQTGIRLEFRSLFAPEQIMSGHSHEEPGQGDEVELMESLYRVYRNLSWSMGGTWQMSHELLWRFNVASAYRTPNMAELTQHGIHGSRYEEGNRNLNSQRSYEGDLSLHYHSGILEFDLAGFYNHINNYIYLAPTNEFDETLQIYRYTQSNARLYGLETFLSIYPMEWLRINTVYTYLRGQQGDGNDLPFIPQDKIRFELKFERKKLGKLLDPYLSLGSAFAFKQNRPAQFETETEGYTLLNAGLGFMFRIQNQRISFLITASNILNAVYYDHLSTLKPMNLYNMGRSVTFSLKVPFRIKGN